MAAIKKINWDKIPKELYPKWVLPQGVLFALWPSPLDDDACLKKAGFSDFADSEDEWHQSFSFLVQQLKIQLESLGPAQLYSSDEFVRQRFGIDRIKSIFIKTSDPKPSLEEMIKIPALDDQFKATLVDFGHPVQVRLKTGEGHPIFWLNFNLSSQNYFESIFKFFAKDYEIHKTPLNWTILL